MAYTRTSAIAILLASGLFAQRSYRFDGNAHFYGSDTVTGIEATPGAFQSVYDACPPRSRGGPRCSWAFVAKLSLDGRLEYLTFLAGRNGSSWFSEILADSTGGAFVLGSYQPVIGPGDFPITRGMLGQPATGGYFLVKLDAKGFPVFSVFIATRTPGSIRATHLGTRSLSVAFASFDNGSRVLQLDKT